MAQHQQSSAPEWLQLLLQFSLTTATAAVWWWRENAIYKQAAATAQMNILAEGVKQKRKSHRVSSESRWNISFDLYI